MKRGKYVLVLVLAICLAMPMFSVDTNMAVYANEKYDTIAQGTYILINKESGKVLDVCGENNSSKHKANVQVYDRLTETTLSQQFQIKKTSDGWYNLIPNSNTKLAVNAYSDTPKNGTNINVYNITNDNTQGWYFEKIGDYYVIRCAYNKNIVMTETGTENLSSVKLTTYKSGKSSQLWTLELLDEEILTGGNYVIINKESGKVLDVYGKNDSSNNKANVQVYTRQSGTCLSQMFKINKVSDGWYNLTPQSNTKLAVNAYSDTPKNGTNVNVYTITNDNTQGWYLEKMDGYYVIRCAYNRNIVMTETGTKDLSSVKLATYESGKDSQLWTLELVDKQAENNTKDVSHDRTLIIDWSKIAEVGNQKKSSYACSCFSLAYCRTILDGTVHSWYEYNKGKGSNELDVSAQWSVGGYSMEYAADKNELFQKAYDSINAGRPLIFYVTSSLGGHYVAVVGYTDVTSLDSLSEGNFLIIDTIYGSTKSQATNLGDKYKLRTVNGKYQYIITNKGGVDTYSTTAVPEGLVDRNLGLVKFFKQDASTCKATAAALAVNLIMGQNTKTTASMISSGVLCINMNGNTYMGSDGNTYKTTYKRDSYVGSFEEEKAAIDEAVLNGLPIVIAVHSTKSGGTRHHWILVVGKQDDDYLVVDPSKKGSGTVADNVHTMSSLNYALGLTDYSTPHYGYISFKNQ
ncbi:MAG: RICIN domain-containing protein [Lachnospiraceae bacterium]|nr:RICIN domain-containing protein [Lachnospiraceae bacterium]